MTNSNEIIIPASKSISNRLLILQYLYPELILKNLSTAKDTKVLQGSLLKIKENAETEINIGHAGTAMRFLTALLSILDGKSFVLDGSERMRQRPIGILVDTLNRMGADIKYIDKTGYPPLKITGKLLDKNSISIQSNLSSQYISALMLIAPKLTDTLQINLEGKQVSSAYIKMTVDILKILGIKVEKNIQSYKIFPQKNIAKQTITIEGDWSSASYLYAFSLILDKKIRLKNFSKNSFQGDKKIAEYFEFFGVKTDFLQDNKIDLIPTKKIKQNKKIEFDLLENPDLAQTIAITCLAKKIPCKLTGLQTLKIKETDRLLALKNEIEKFGVPVHITDSSIEFNDFSKFNSKNISIKTYDDHRMAMSFAIIKLIYPEVKIENPEVVVKSFPDFWDIFDILKS